MFYPCGFFIMLDKKNATRLLRIRYKKQTIKQKESGTSIWFSATFINPSLTSLPIKFLIVAIVLLLLGGFLETTQIFGNYFDCFAQICIWHMFGEGAVQFNLYSIGQIKERSNLNERISLISMQSVLFIFFVSNIKYHMNFFPSIHFSFYIHVLFNTCWKNIFKLTN